MRYPALRIRREPGHQRMRIEITQQRQRLEEQHADGPDRGGSAEPRQYHAADDGLKLEQKEGAQKNSERVGAGAQKSGAILRMGLVANRIQSRLT
jgi:hypothetical protein